MLDVRRKPMKSRNVPININTSKESTELNIESDNLYTKSYGLFLFSITSGIHYLNGSQSFYLYIVYTLCCDTTYNTQCININLNV